PGAHRSSGPRHRGYGMARYRAVNSRGRGVGGRWISRRVTFRRRVPASGVGEAVDGDRDTAVHRHREGADQEIVRTFAVAAADIAASDARAVPVHHRSAREISVVDPDGDVDSHGAVGRVVASTEPTFAVTPLTAGDGGGGGDDSVSDGVGSGVPVSVGVGVGVGVGVAVGVAVVVTDSGAALDLLPDPSTATTE